MQCVQNLMTMLILIVATFLRYFCFGDTGLIIGVWNPASFTTFAEIPKGSTSSFSNVTIKIAPSNLQITSLASDPRRAVIFAAINEVIHIYNPFPTLQNVSAKFSIQYRGKSFSFGQIAFDYVSSNLYWCDTYLNWIAMKPAYNFNDSIYKVIVQKDLNQPEGLALDSEDRFMFFSDNYPNARIEKSSLDGQNRQVIVFRGLLLVRALTVDTANNKLYWADRQKQTIEGSNYDGSNRKVIRRFKDSVDDLSYHQKQVIKNFTIRQPTLCAAELKKSYSFATFKNYFSTSALLTQCEILQLEKRGFPGWCIWYQRSVN